MTGTTLQSMPRAGTCPARAESRALEWSIAWRYLRSRKGSRLLSFISVVAIGGVVVGVSALILIMGVMNGLQNDLRDKILVGSPDLRVLDLRRRPQDRRLAARAGQGAALPGRRRRRAFRPDAGAVDRGAQLRRGRRRSRASSHRDRTSRK